MVSDIFTIQNVDDFRKLIKSSIDGTDNVSGEAMQNSVSAFLEQTGLIDEAVNILKEKLLCAVCLGIPLNASLTECHHIFCNFCLDLSGCWVDKLQCPICRTELSVESFINPKRLYQIDTIIDAVMSKCNSHYVQWKEQEVHKRTWHVLTSYNRMIHDKIVEFLEDTRNINELEGLRKDLSNRAPALLLETEFSCSKANSGHIIKIKEHCKGVIQLLEQMKTRFGRR